MTPTTTCLFSVLCIARCGPKGKKRKEKKDAITSVVLAHQTVPIAEFFSVSPTKKNSFSALAFSHPAEIYRQ
jgi:hypothetical protein